MTPTLFDLALKAGFSDPIEGWMGEAYEERLEAFAKLIIEHEASKQEPVAAQCKFDREVKWGWCEIAHHNLVQAEPQNWPDYQTRLLYTSPPAQRKPLTDEEIEREWQFLHDEEGNPPDHHDFARAIEFALGIKENT
jgi:hypothetical protein